MNVTLKANTNVSDILTFVGSAAGACTDKSGIKDEERALRCIKQGHHSVLEHISFTWYIEGISRACSHQLVRHRLASFTQESQRYVKIDTASEDWYVIPPDIESDVLKRMIYKPAMNYAARMYNDLLKDGVKAEDARFVLPNATKTNIWVTMNLREFLHFYQCRTDKHAQWEIRELAENMLDEVRKGHPEIVDILDEMATN